MATVREDEAENSRSISEAGHDFQGWELFVNETESLLLDVIEEHEVEQAVNGRDGHAGIAQNSGRSVEYECRFHQQFVDARWRSDERRGYELEDEDDADDEHPRRAYSGPPLDQQVNDEYGQRQDGERLEEGGDRKVPIVNRSHRQIRCM